MNQTLKISATKAAEYLNMTPQEVVGLVKARVLDGKIKKFTEDPKSTRYEVTWESVDRYLANLESTQEAT